MSFCSSSVSARFTFAGEPSTREPGGIFDPSVTRALAPMMGASTDFRPIENNCAHPDQNFVVDGASVYDGAMTDGDELAQSHLVRRVDMNDGIVLNIRARADNDAIEIAAQNGAIPDT